MCPSPKTRQSPKGRLSPSSGLALNRLEFRCVQAVVVILCAACLALTGARPGSADVASAPVAEEISAGRKSDPTVDSLTTDDIEWVSEIDANTQPMGERDSVLSAQSPQELKKLWHERFGNRLSTSDSLPDPRSSVDQLLARQIGHVYSILDGVGAPADTLDGTKYSVFGEARDAIHNLADLAPLFQAAKDSIRSALLVVSSVGCECELRRCEDMTRLYESLRGDSSNCTVTMVDVMQVPSLSDVVGPVDMPYWALFDEGGKLTLLVGGNLDPDDVKSNIRSWLGVSETD